MYIVFRSTFWGEGKCVQVFVWKTPRKRPLRSSALRREYIFKIDLGNDLYCSPNIVRVIKWRRMRWAEHVVRMGNERCVCRVLVGKPERKRPLGRPRSR
jgi:hypothetical protein